MVVIDSRERDENNRTYTLCSFHHSRSSFFFSTSCRTLLRLHNLRAVILILTCLTTACEIGIACLSMARSTDGVSSYAIESVLCFVASIMSTASLLRVIEVRKSKSGETIITSAFKFPNTCSVSSVSHDKSVTNWISENYLISMKCFINKTSIIFTNNSSFHGWRGKL